MGPPYYAARSRSNYQNVASISESHNYDRLYGSVGTAVVLLLYFFISTFIVLFGAELNAVVEHFTQAGKNSGEKALP
jgi:uncharacterized BrkB/YihY/UPF0761 family membrane protein